MPRLTTLHHPTLLFRIPPKDASSELHGLAESLIDERSVVIADCWTRGEQRLAARIVRCRFFEELNDAISKGTPESRLKALWHATDMLIMGRYTESEIWIFGEVIGRLSDEIELAARSQLAKRLARSDKAPVYIINKLAFDDS